MTRSPREKGQLPRLLRGAGGEEYELVECIGQGATGTVYRARDRGLSFPREVCIKSLSLDVASELAVDLREEARLLASLRHVNLVSLLGFGEEGGGRSPFLVLELVSGTDLRELSRLLARAPEEPRRLPWRLAVHVACALLRALGAVHRRLPGLVHRDITPHNVLVSTEGEVKLADFGIALTQERAARRGSSSVRGKVGYMAPEQLRGDPLDVRSDLFAVGVVLYELLAGARPTGHRRGEDELRAVETGDLVPLELHRGDLSPSLVATIGRLLAPDPAGRHPSPDAALRALGPYGAGELGSLRMADFVRGAVRSRPSDVAPRASPEPLTDPASIRSRNRGH